MELQYYCQRKHLRMFLMYSCFLISLFVWINIIFLVTYSLKKLVFKIFHFSLIIPLIFASLFVSISNFYLIFYRYTNLWCQQACTYTVFPLPQNVWYACFYILSIYKTICRVKKKNTFYNYCRKRKGKKKLRL